MLLRILVYAIALSLFLLLGWLTHHLLTPDTDISYERGEVPDAETSMKPR